MQDPFEHCEQVVRETDKDRFLACLFAPTNRRGALFALYAFNSEVARVREVIREPMAGEIRLQWWRDALERPGSGEAQANPIAAALLDSVIRFRLPAQSLIALIEAREFDLYRDPMPTLATLEAYAEKTSSTLIDLAATILGTGGVDLSSAVRHGGLAYAITGLLRAFPLHAARGQLYVPLEILERHGAKPEDVFAGRAGPGISAALAEMRRIARSHYDAYAQAARTIPPAPAPAFLPLALVPLYLKRLERSAQRPFQIVEVPQWRRQWVLWRGWGGGWAG
jgi:15-cis-phytoene synthase